MDQTAKIHDAATGKVIQVLKHPEHVNSVALSPDGKLLATAGLGKTISVWDVVTGKEKSAFVAHQGGVYTVAFSPDGKSIASCGGDKTARVWDAATGKEQLVLAGHDREVEYVVFSPDGKMLATASWDHRSCAWPSRRTASCSPRAAASGPSRTSPNSRASSSCGT
jgi:WD40 repeat protein